MNPHQLSFAKQSGFKSWECWPESAKTSWSQKGWCNKPTKLQFQSILYGKFWCSPNATNQQRPTVELGYMCPRGLTGPPAVTLTKKLKYKKRLLLRFIHHFKSDLINNMDHMRISDNEPSSVILCQTKWFQKLRMLTRKCKNKLKPKGMV